MYVRVLPATKLMGRERPRGWQPRQRVSGYSLPLLGTGAPRPNNNNNNRRLVTLAEHTSDHLGLGPSIMLINIVGVSLVLCGMAGLVLCARAEFDCVLLDCVLLLSPAKKL